VLSPRDWIEALGDGTIRLVRYVGGVGLMTADTVRHTVVGPFRGRPVKLKEVWSQMVRVGPRSLLVVFQVNFFVGLILALIGGKILRSIATGFTVYVGDLMSVGMVLELGPLLTAIIMTGFIGAALTAEIGTMVVTEEVTALRTTGLHPVRYLVAPRLLATIVMIPCVTVLGDLIGILGGLLVASQVLEVGANSYWEHAWAQLGTHDIRDGLVKSCVFGLIIGLIGCYQGFQVKGGAEGVGRTTTQAVVACIISIIVADAVLNYILLFG
jgi:phospholipid/cholesterol/gamma-HCH transport system permease protein